MAAQQVRLRLCDRVVHPGVCADQRGGDGAADGLHEQGHFRRIRALIPAAAGTAVQEFASDRRAACLSPVACMPRQAVRLRGGSDSLHSPVRHGWPPRGGVSRAAADLRRCDPAARHAAGAR